MRVLVIGGGGREHALCWKIAQSPVLETLYCSPGNPGISALAQCVTLDHHDYPGLITFCQAKQIDLVVIGPEAPLVDGMADHLREAGITCFGPGKAAARIEGSKEFCKQLCERYQVPTAAYGSFTEAQSAIDYIKTQGAPIVVKADGLAAGKGVTVAMTQQEAVDAVQDAFGGKFGDAGKSVIIEAFLEGQEVSLFALISDGTALSIGAAQDHKAVGEGDTGPNTGGMGTYSPTPIFTDAMHKHVMDTIIQPIASGLDQEGISYRGVLFAGLMLTAEGPQLLEFNVRFGDPETQVLMARLEDDILPLLRDTATGQLQQDRPIAMSDDAALCVVMASNGYPGSYKKNTIIRGLEQAEAMPEVTVFHAGTAEKDGQIVASGGRVLGITAKAGSIAMAQQRAYHAVDCLDWPDGFCRRDIGWRAITAAHPKAANG